jgi:pimeloyl-ACP methyl ester carboxylesterase
VIAPDLPGYGGSPAAGPGFALQQVTDRLGEVHVWHGERDRFVPVEHARAVAAALPRCRARFDAHDGHFFFRRRVAEVLGSLVAAAAA